MRFRALSLVVLVVVAACSGADDTAATDATPSTTTTTAPVIGVLDGAPPVSWPEAPDGPCSLLGPDALAEITGLSGWSTNPPVIADQCQWYQSGERLTVTVLLRAPERDDLVRLRAGVPGASTEELSTPVGALAVRDDASGAVLEIWVPVTPGVVLVAQSLPVLTDDVLTSVATRATAPLTS
ncbi:MAG TPA: hypothetical protein VK866_14140 [Acidimicrobiales bacterium]|nr:hypothetical protein [Acidimicrobiales bacterium]